MQKAKEKYSKEKSAEYYTENKEAIKEKSRARYKNLWQKQTNKKKRLKCAKQKNIKNWFSIKNKR